MAALVALVTILQPQVDVAMQSCRTRQGCRSPLGVLERTDLADLAPRAAWGPSSWLVDNSYSALMSCGK